ncbi:hypothetical protein ABZW96_24810 [Nocardia sp. NPDC004168]
MGGSRADLLSEALDQAQPVRARAYLRSGVRAVLAVGPPPL